MGAIPTCPTINWGISSVGRTSALHAEGQGFKSLILHHIGQYLSWLESSSDTRDVASSNLAWPTIFYRGIAQLVSALVLQTKGPQFESVYPYHISEHGLVWFRALGLGPRDFGGSNPPAPTIFVYYGDKVCNKDC